MLIGGACVVLEAEFDHLLTAHARPIADDLIALLHPKAAARVLVKWRAGTKPPTVGTHGVVLVALRRGLERGRTAVCDLLRRCFDDDYLPLLRSGGPTHCLERIRSRYRNPAMHGIYADKTPATFDSAAYEAFVHPMFATASFESCARDAPPTAPPAADP